MKTMSKPAREQRVNSRNTLKHYAIRIEWGGITSYVDRGMSEYDWSGGVEVRGGRLRTLFRIISRDYGHFVYTENRLPLPAPAWRERTQNSMGGIILELDGRPDTEIIVTTTQKQVRFKLSDLLKQKYLRWPVGAKYSGVAIMAMPEDGGPFDFYGRVAPDCLDLRLTYDAFRGAARYGLFNTLPAAWIKPGQSVTATFKLPRAPLATSSKQSAFVLEMRLSLAKNMDVSHVDSSRYSPFDVRINGRTVKITPVYFRTEESVWPGTQWIEFVTMPVPGECLKAGSNSIRVRNGSRADILTLASAQFREEIRTDGQIVSAPRWLLAGQSFDVVVRCLSAHDHIRTACENAEVKLENKTMAAGEHRLACQAGAEPRPAVIRLMAGKRTLCRVCIPVFAVPMEAVPWKVGGTLQNVRMDESGELENFINYVHDTQMGNYLQFRPESSCPYRCNVKAVRLEDWRRWARLLKERKIYFTMIGAHDFKNYNMGKIMPDPRFYEWCRQLQAGGGEYFFSAHIHEYSLWIYGKMPDKPSLAPDENNMRAASRKYAQAVAALEGLPGVSRQGGQSVPLMAYDYAGKMDYIAVETMALNAMHLFAAMRGAARAFERKIWGTHNATYWVKVPDDFTKLGLNYLNWYLTYMSGGNFATSEDGHYKIPHNGRQQGFESEEPVLLREQIRQFYRYVSTHPRRGEPEVDIAVALGNFSCELISFPLRFVNAKRSFGRVWGKFGASTPEWEYGDPERGMELLDVFMPYWQDGENIRHWFTGTPYGQFDLAPIWQTSSALLATYRLLVFLGWNTMTPEIYQKLLRYVEGGGTLFMAVPHLLTRADRLFLAEMPKTEMIRNGDCRDLFGVKIKGPTPRKSWRPRWMPAGKNDRLVEYAPCRYSPLSHLADVELEDGARVLAADDQENRPVLVEKRLGKGRALLLTTWAYPGHAPLQPFVRDALHLLAEETQKRSAFRVEDHSNEVAHACWRAKSGLRNLYLLNTDWTMEGNVKNTRIHIGQQVVPVQVPERRMVALTWRNKLAVLPQSPDIYVEDIVAAENGVCRVILHGSRPGKVDIHGLGTKVAAVTLAGKSLKISSGGQNTGVSCEIDFSGSTRCELVVKT